MSRRVSDPSFIEHHGEADLDPTLNYFGVVVPDALVSARLSLSSLKECHKDIETDVWVSPSEASAARKSWQSARAHLKVPTPSSRYV